ncbi:DUF2007 domain-containing protein [Bacteroides sedimenti]|uniref:DUF2007 domain-containing protein n=1 Tax=Bacteroides sedimenti TaxID=2136147 RepID=A0ABM8IA25_9BACE
MKTVLLSALENSFQASVLRDVLSNEGIESFLRNETLSGILGNIPNFQIEIYVFEDDYEKASEILKNAFPQLVGE